MGRAGRKGGGGVGGKRERWRLLSEAYLPAALVLHLHLAPQAAGVAPPDV